jgi:phosphatidylserine synthase
VRFVTNMQKIVSFIPNLFTLGNLFCGCLAIIYAFNWQLDWAAYMVFLAAFLDFFDGFLARLLKVEGELGKQLDSLADMVSFGVVPGIVMFQWLRRIYEIEFVSSAPENIGFDFYMFNINSVIPWYSYVALIIPIFSCYRLAKFNIDTRQSHGFIGLPTPANAIFFCSLMLITSLFPFNPASDSALDIPPITKTWGIDNAFSSKPNVKLPQAYASVKLNNQSDLTDEEVLEAQGGSPVIYQHYFQNTHWLAVKLTTVLLNKYFILSLIIIFSFLLVSPLPLFALKFKNFGWADNKIRYVFLVLCAVLLIVFQVIAIPFIVILYILTSIVNIVFKLTV